MARDSFLRGRVEKPGYYKTFFLKGKKPPARAAGGRKSMVGERKIAKESREEPDFPAHAK